ncbi:MerR family transcriptional regulator [Streptomyces sp. NPDC088816]|uniref:MerR family transcriptional regulator n=1 Tax=Streptomyces sp. NPDC088816 TaxID=3365906 RepID=UPI0037F22E3B
MPRTSLTVTKLSDAGSPDPAEAAQRATAWRRLVSAGAAEVTPATVRQWASRGHLEPCGLDESGHPLYALADLARAEKATRNRALRLAGIPTR